MRDHRPHQEFRRSPPAWRKASTRATLYNDSDVYKVLEGVAYALADKRDPDLEKRADAIIDLIAAAQQPDGYLDTYFTLVEPQNRWKNIQYGHELYCAGHLIEAAVAYQQATGKRQAARRRPQAGRPHRLDLRPRQAA